MSLRKKRPLKIISLLTALFFLGSTFGAYAQQAPVTVPAPSTAGTVTNVANFAGSHPELQMMSANLGNMENSLRQIEHITQPLYNRIVPTNMEAMSIADRVKAILGNTKTVVQDGIRSYKGQVNDFNAKNGIAPGTSFEEELGVGLNQLGVETAKMPMNGKGNALVDKLKIIISAIKDKLSAIIQMIRAKITALAQKVGIMKKSNDSAKAPSEKSPSKEETGSKNEIPVNGDQGQTQYADTFSGKLSKGVAEGTANAKQSLKSSFSLSNLAVTTTVAVGTNLAIQIAKGQRPSFGAAARQVATVEFAGSVLGGALGAAGGQFASTLVKTFMPGPIGSLVGAFVPVLTGSFGAQMGSGMAGSLKHGQFSISQAWSQIDKVDLLGSSIGSTIGMALGAPIPIIGPIIGGIVGGFLGSKVAKLVESFARGRSITSLWRPGTNVPAPTNTRTGEISIGNIGAPSPMTPNIPKGVTLVNSERTAAAVPASSGEIRDAERKYYETYLQYNKLVEQGKYDDAKKIYANLKTYSDQYNALKGQPQSASK